MRGHYFYIIIMHYNLENIFIKQHFETQLESIKTENTCIHLWGVNLKWSIKVEPWTFQVLAVKWNIYKFCSYIYLDLISIIIFFYPYLEKDPNLWLKIIRISSNCTTLLSKCPIWSLSSRCSRCIGILESLRCMGDQWL